MKECMSCGFNDEDYGCACPHSDKWYACPIENKKPENVKALEEYVEWEGRRMTREYDIVEKIRAEIAGYGSLWVSYTILGHTDHDIEAIVENVLKQAKEQVLAVIDKYRESEDKA